MKSMSALQHSVRLSSEKLVFLTPVISTLLAVYFGSSVINGLAAIAVFHVLVGLVLQAWIHASDCLYKSAVLALPVAVAYATTEFYFWLF